MQPNLPDISRRIETDRSGPFVFELGVDPTALVLPMQRVLDAHERFVASPLAQVAKNLEREVVVSSVFGTNTIEGGTLTEDETATAIDLDPSQVQAIEQRRVLNITAAYDRARQVATMGSAWKLTTDFIGEIHALITHDLPHADNRPGLIRNNRPVRTGRSPKSGEAVPVATNYVPHFELVRGAYRDIQPTCRHRTGSVPLIPVGVDAYLDQQGNVEAGKSGQQARQLEISLDTCAVRAGR